jgi:hypothetical protein
MFAPKSAPQVNTFPTTMNITSSAFNQNDSIPSKFTCDGDNVSPELVIHSVPENAKSLAIILDDPDAPMGTFTHWLIWNIDPKTDTIKEKSVPLGAIEGKNGAGRVGYIGPCPPSGTHHYHFTLYALDAMLDLPNGANREALLGKIQKHTIISTEFIGLYSRS